MRFPLVFRRAKGGSPAADVVLGSESTPTTTPPTANADNVLFCRIRDVNGWPVQRIAFCFCQTGAFTYTVTSAGTTPPVVSLTGTTSQLVAIEIDIDSIAGGATRGLATFQWKLNGVVQATGVATAATVPLATPFGTLTANFATGTNYATDNVYTSHDTVTALNFNAYFWESATQHWYLINATAISANPNELYFFDTVSISEPPPTAASLAAGGASATTGSMEIMILATDPGSQVNGEFTIAAGPDLTTVGT